MPCSLLQSILYCYNREHCFTDTGLLGGIGASVPNTYAN